MKIFLAQKLTKLEQFQPNGAPAHSLNACKAPRPVKSQRVKVDPPSPPVIFYMFLNVLNCLKMYADPWA